MSRGSCALTGHRRLKKEFKKQVLFHKLEILIQEGCTIFFCGMAMGFDMVACECLLELKKNYIFKIIACVPAPEQADKYPEKEKEKYFCFLKQCDETIIISESLTSGSYFQRNRYMVDHADFVFAYLYEQRGGTAYTVKYAKQQGKEIIFV